MAQASQPRLLATAGPLKGETFELPPGSSGVGRASGSRVLLRDASVSRDHCTVECTGETCVIRDSRSHNGTFVNGAPITEKPLTHGDEVRVGNSTFLFLTTPDPDVEAHATAHRTTELHISDSLYLSAAGEPSDLAGSVRITHDLRLLVRLSTVLHSLRALYGARNEPAQIGFARHLLSLLRDMVPADRGAVLIPKSSGEPVTLLSEGNEPWSVSQPVIDRVMADSVAVFVAGGGDEPATLAAPMIVRNEIVAILYLESSHAVHRFDEGHLQILTAVAGMSSVAWENASILEWLREENELLKEELHLRHDMVGESPLLRELQKQIGRVAASPTTVLILGESGTGKELIARAIHGNSPRAHAPFIAINCAALTDSLLESELFGYEKGAFTGALAQRKGKLEAAEGGTVFLDEIGELSPSLQAKLLRVLQQRELQRVGGTQTVKLNIRVLAATNRDLQEAVTKGEFRQDLFYRLNVVTLTSPPLRHRTEDIMPLAEHFAKKYAEQMGRKITGFAPATRAYLQAYSWPGNVRELENAIERAVVLGSEDVILPEDLPDNIREKRPSDLSATLYEEAVENAKRQVVLQAFEKANYDHETASKLLGLHPNYLHRLLRNMDLRGTLKESRRR